jgi:hypothetical protein
MARRLPILAALAALSVAPALGLADDRKFTYTYETTTMPKGDFEYEQWVTWKTEKASDTSYDRLDIRHEFEYGVTDNFQLALYVDWRYQDGRSVTDDGAEFRDVAFEAIYSLTNPVTDPLGIALYGETAIGDEIFKLEAKLLLQKNIGSWIFAWNGIFEAEWEGEDYSEDKGELAQTFGVAYNFTPKFSLGAELLHEIEFDDWETQGEHVLYVGPAIHYSASGWWITVTPLVQVTDVDSEANVQTRMIFGLHF